MSHEIRTPLNGVIGFAEIGQRHCEDSGRTRAAFEKILQSGRLLLGVVNDILDFSKMEQGKLGIESVPVDLIELMRETLVPIEEAARAKHLALYVRKAANLPHRCLTDPLRLKQILTNLLSNAAKFTRQGSVTLSVRQENDELVWTVADTGIGMTPDQLDRLFQPFEQGDGSTTREFGGTGLGLAITRRLADLLGAGIRVDSTPGNGTVFELRLPYRAVDADLAATAGTHDSVPPPAPSGHALAGLSILVAEDNEINQRVLEANLVDEGAVVVFAGDGRDAVQRIVENGPDAFDLVLMDVQMPEMDGYEATRRIRELAPDLPVVGQTAHVCDEERAKCLSAGMVAHIAKPIDPRQLVSVIRHYTGHRRGHSAAAGVSGSDRIAVSSDTTGPNAECPPC
jgi:CheY-like chemotaxis protein